MGENVAILFLQYIVDRGYDQNPAKVDPKTVTKQGDWRYLMQKSDD